MQVKLSKCLFAQPSLAYLGHIISEHGVATDPEKIQVVKIWPVPVNVKEVRNYRKFVCHFGILVDFSVDCSSSGSF